MAKKKQRKTSSSTHHNEQIRQQPGQSNDVQSQTTKRKSRKRVSSRRSPWLLVGGILIATAAIIGLFAFLSNQSSSHTNGPTNTPTDAVTFKDVTNVDSKLLSQIGTGGVPNPFKVTQNSAPLLIGPTGKPEVFYYGAEFCHYVLLNDGALLSR